MNKVEERLDTGITYPNGRSLQRLHFRFLMGDSDWREHGGKFVSKRLHNGDWHYWIVISICRDPNDDGYWSEVAVVSPEAAEQQLPEAMRCLGVDYDYDHPEESWRGNRKLTELDLVEYLACYGTFATIENFSSRSLKKVILAAKDVANAASSVMLGFMMDRQVNVFGACGWDFVKGDVYGGTRSKESYDGDIAKLVKLLAEPQPKYIKEMYRALVPLKNRTSKIKKEMGYE